MCFNGLLRRYAPRNDEEVVARFLAITARVGKVCYSLSSIRSLQMEIITAFLPFSVVFEFGFTSVLS